MADVSYPTSTLRRGRVQGGGDISPTLTTESGVCKIMEIENKIDDYMVKDFGIFKLSPRECLRMMNVEEKHIDRMMDVNSNTQCYKQAGNSIVVAVLMAIFSQLNIKGVTPWNELTDDQREKLIYKGCVVK